jgi:autotransporter family porin
LGFPGSLDATTVGVRTDSGYRFGSFHGGAFIEPLATISLNWAEIDGFTLGGNKVSFGDDPDVRGRLGLRVGTSLQAWTGTTMEPFVIGSLWGNLSDDNKATLVSTGTSFTLKDDLQDVWGEVSAGVNFFNPSANTSVFAKGRCHLRRRYRRRRRQGRHARRLVASATVNASGSGQAAA